jgi:hypothetical protein
MSVILPSWFNQRQGKAEAAGENTYRLTAPNLKPALISIHRDDNGRWSAALRLEEDGPVVAATGPELPRSEEAWEAAFELYRRQVVV